MRAARVIALGTLALATHLRGDGDFDAKLAEAMKSAAKPAPTVAPAAAAAKPRPKPAVKKAQPAAAALAVSSTAEFADVLERLKALEAPKAPVAERFKYELFSHLRYESQDSRKVRGAYIRRAEGKITGKLGEYASAVLGYDIVENKVKDAGLEAEFPLIKLQVGQFRQKFGIEPQTGSLKTWFPERAMIYGGLQPLTTNAKLVAERVLGVHVIHKKKLGAFGYELGLSLANDLSEDQAPGKNKISVADAFPKQAVDENPSLSARLGMDAGWSWGKAGLGLSYSRDNQNASFLATLPSDQRYDELSGLDMGLELLGQLRLQAEWVADNSIRGDTGLGAHREGYYAQGGWKFMKAFTLAGPDLELLGRFENFQPGMLAEATGALVWRFYGAQQLSLAYSAFGPGQNFGAGAGTELWMLQQQLVF